MKKRYFNKWNFKSKLFRKMFLSYVFMIVLLLALYSLYIFMETRSTGRQRQEQYYNIKLEEVANHLNRLFASADNVVANMAASEVIEKYVWGVADGAAGLGEDAAAVNQAIKNYTRAANNFNIVGAYLFVDGLDKIFSNTAAYAMDAPFLCKDRNEPGLSVGSIARTYGIVHQAAVLNKNYLMMNARYDNMIKEGRICILLDMDGIADELAMIVGEAEGIRISVGDIVLYEKGHVGNPMDFRKMSLYDNDVSYRLTVDGGNLYVRYNAPMILALAAAFLLGIVLILVAFVLVSSYYGPVGNISRLMSDFGEYGGENEFENITKGIETLIGERNGYREKMVSIKPYVRQGMFYGMMNGSVEHDKIDLLVEDEYAVLQKSYFVLGIINAACVESAPDTEAFYKRIRMLTREIAAQHSGEEFQIVTYDKDVNNIFVIVNSDSPEGMNEIFYTIYDTLTAHMDNKAYAITIGVDTVRESIGEIAQAVDGAFAALENIMAAGRGAVYFAESSKALKSEYYFPKDATGKVVQALKAKNTDYLRKLLADIVCRNLREHDLTPEGARLLVDEIHITTIRAVREANVYNIIDFDIRKPDMVAPLEEIAQYYCAIYEAVSDQLSLAAHAAKEMDTLDGEILECIDREFAEEKMSLQYLTEKFGMSNKYITHLCKKRLGKTYLAYIQEKRIHYAVELMKGESCSLENVAAMCGYTNPLTFRRNFKAVMGVNPSEYGV